MKNRSKSPFYKNKIFIITIIICLLALGVSALLLKNRNSPQRADSRNDSGSSEEEEINLNPPTEQDKKAAADNKDRIIEEQNSNPGSPLDEAKSVTPVITIADKNGVAAYIPGIIEESGTCTTVAVKGNQKYSASSTSFGNVSNTQCPPIDWDTPLTPGSWAVTLTYSSPTAQGSTTKTIEVQ